LEKDEMKAVEEMGRGSKKGVLGMGSSGCSCYSHFTATGSVVDSYAIGMSFIVLSSFVLRRSLGVTSWSHYSRKTAMIGRCLVSPHSDP